MIATAFLIWGVLKVATKSSSPLTVVLSGSMESAFYRGDMLLLTMYDAPFEVGEIVVFKLEGRDVPIVHRIIEVRETTHGETKILTKGDNNESNDRGLYNPGQLWLKRDDIQGRVKGRFPYIGYVTILTTESPWFKYLLIAALGLWTIVSN